MVKHKRRGLPIRVSMVGLSVLVYAFNSLILIHYGIDCTQLALVVVGIIGVAIGGDSYRPSGMVSAAPVSTAPATAIEEGGVG